MAIDVLASVEFNDKAAIYTNKVCDVFSYRKLPAELAAIELPIAQGMPEFRFRTIVGFTKASGSIGQF